ncbi:hypothetical protein [Microseira wollei]|uniref:hypothetical protein n=1 Tax=Microseira wollei TaxID=467598 RepID=UPI001CFEBCF3|nr:hypothetical protein [Microseira wollei]
MNDLKISKYEGFVLLVEWIDTQNRVLAIDRFEVVCNKAKFLKAEAAEKLENPEISKMGMKEMLHRT